MNLYSKARKHIDMSRVKELREEKIKEEKIAEVLKQQEVLLVELKKEEIKEDPIYSNWRRELNEQMMTTDALRVTLPPQGNANLADFAFPVIALGSSPGYVQSGNDYTFGPASAGVPPAESSSINVTMNSEKYDTIVFDWVNSGVIDKFFAFTGSDGGSNTYNFSTSSGRKEIRLKPSDRKRSVSIAFNIQRNAGGGLGTNKILNVTFQRRTPVNVFVGLDSPEATSFVRDGRSDALSPNQKKKKIEDQLKAGSDYLDKMFGTNVMPKYATKIAEYEPQQSFMDIQVGDQRITKVNNKTVTDTTKKIKDGKMDGKPIYYDNQGNMRVSQPQPKPKSITTTTTTTSNTDRTSITNVPKTTTFTSTTDTSSYEDREGYKTGIPAVDYSADIAGSIKSNTPVNIPQKNIPKDQINKLINAIDPNSIGEYGIPINATPQPYSDDHFYELPNGEVKKHTASSRAKYPNNTNPLSSGNTGFMGKGNPLGAAGQAQAQFVAPKDGSEPYYQYTDHAYVNSAQMGGGEIPDPIKTLGSIGVHAASGYGKKFSPLDSPYHQTGGVLDTTTPNTGKMKNYPSYIRGDVRKQVKVPLSQMPPKVQDAVNKQIKLGSVKESVEKIKQKRRLKSPKDLADKIPGYYDGKPAPLGFPIVEPPKMKDGMHPDLVDGKKVAKRFNRLDPISAKAMPPTGNPHIDKKVRAAAKKPK